MSDAEKFSVKSVKVGDEVIYVDRTRAEAREIVCFLRTNAGRQIGIEMMQNGLPILIAEREGFLKEPWRLEDTMRVAKIIALAAGLLGEVAEMPSSISTTHRIRIGPPI